MNTDIKIKRRKGITVVCHEGFYKDPFYSMWHAKGKESKGKKAGKTEGKEGYRGGRMKTVQARPERH